MLVSGLWQSLVTPFLITSWIVRGLGMGGAEVKGEDAEEEGMGGLRVVEEAVRGRREGEELIEDKGAQALVLMLVVKEMWLF